MTQSIWRSSALFITLNFLAAGQAMAIEEPAYTVVDQAERFEVRRYDPFLVAETLAGGEFEEVGNTAFRILASYIFGNNIGKTKIDMTAPVAQQAAGEKIAMTAPVSQQRSHGMYSVTFTMPAGYTMESLPQPVDERVILREVPSQLMAVRRYSGTWSARGYQRNLEALLATLDAQGYDVAGDPVWARYNSPFSLPILRRNEVQIPVTMR